MGLFFLSIWENRNFETPEKVLDAYLSEVKQRPYSFEKAIGYVDKSNLDDEFIQALKQESTDSDAPTYMQYNFTEQSIESSNEKASIRVEFIYGSDYSTITTFHLKKDNGDWKLDLQNIQEEFYSVTND